MLEQQMELVELIKTGHLAGFVTAFKLPGRLTSVVLAGRYREEPIRALGLVSRAQHRINNLVDGSADPGPIGGDNIREFRR